MAVGFGEGISATLWQQTLKQGVKYCLYGRGTSMTKETSQPEKRRSTNGVLEFADKLWDVANRVRGRPSAIFSQPIARISPILQK